jgi:purine-binding chemotaxis protein CheW
MTSNDAEDQTQYLTFFIAEEEYAIGILRVREIIQYDTVTRVPRMPGWIRGVINLRGGVVPVLDLGVKLGLPVAAVTKETCIVITELDVDGEQGLLGVVADRVSQVIDLPPSDVEPAPAFGTRIRVDYLLGMGKAGKKFVLILDTDKVLSSDELTAAAAIGSDAASLVPDGGGDSPRDASAAGAP